MVRPRTVVILSIAGSFLAGCASRSQLDITDLPPSASGGPSEHIIDNGYLAFYSTGEWETSTASSGYEGGDYAYSNSGSGDSVATWNLNIIKSFDVYAKWTSHPNRGSNVKYVVHYLNNNDNLVTDTVTVDQRENGGEWFKLGTYRMSALTGRVTVSDDANGYVIADAILFREVGTPTDGITDDIDGDGIPDQWEIDHGMDANDPLDAFNDPDHDGLTNEDEYLFLTNPTTPDTDADGIPDGFEVSYGLDPTVDDAGLDSDQDGLTNYQEYLAETDPNDSNSNLSSNSVLLTWEAPTQRTDGTELSKDEITQYEISYQKVSSTGEIVVDNESSNFVSYGDRGFESSSSDGYIGKNYFTMPSGSGEISAEWSTYDLTPGAEYELRANWTSYPNRGSNATYQYTYINSNGEQTSETVTVDQRENGGSWQQLAIFETSDPIVTVRIDNNADGYVIADAIGFNETSPDEKSVTVDQSTHNSYVLKELSQGAWQFKIRAVDSDGLKSDYSEIKTIQVE